MAENLTKLFVYGTLMQGHRNHGFMKGGKFLGKAMTADASFEMKLLPSRSSPGRFSPVVVSDSNAHIVGELYEIDDKTLRTIDTLEGNRYVRAEIKTDIGHLAQMYLYCAKGESFVKKSDPDYKARVHLDPKKQTYSWIVENTWQESDLGWQS